MDGKTAREVYEAAIKRAREAFVAGLKPATLPHDPLHDFCMLIGDEGVDWDYYETDPDWWALRLFTRRN